MRCYRSRVQDLGVLAGLFIICLSFSQTLYAYTPRLHIQVNVQVLEPTCTFNNGQSTIRVDFGNSVLISAVDGQNYMRDIVYSLHCSGLSNNSMRFKLSGKGAYNSQYLATNKTGLGIVFYAGGRVLPLNEWRSFNYSSLPTLQSAPIKQSGVNLAGGSFSSTATLLVEYQ